MNDDYYFKYVNATSRVAGSKYVIEQLIKALKQTEDDSINTQVALKLAESELVEMIKVLNGEYA